MVIFLPIQQELNCINDSGSILGKIRYAAATEEFMFYPANASISLSNSEKSSINQKISDIHSGNYSIPMQDDD
tara:strand:- start:306 stop:524 length:219 start_codon:yes stop_codon:yes gene_type:complete